MVKSCNRTTCLCIQKKRGGSFQKHIDKRQVIFCGFSYMKHDKPSQTLLHSYTSYMFFYTRTHRKIPAQLIQQMFDLPSCLPLYPLIRRLSCLLWRQNDEKERPLSLRFFAFVNILFSTENFIRFSV